MGRAAATRETSRGPLLAKRLASRRAQGRRHRHRENDAGLTCRAAAASEKDRRRWRAGLSVNPEGSD